MNNHSNSYNDSVATFPQNNILGVPVKVILYACLLVMSLVGNTLVIVVILRTKHLRTDFNYLIVNMTVSDLVVPLVALPLRITQESVLRHLEWFLDGPLGNALCKLCYFVTDISPVVSVLTLILISVNRFIVTTFPIRRQICSTRMNRLLIALVWFIAMSFFSPYFYAFRLVNTWGYTQCVLLWSPAFDEITAHTIFISMNIVLFFFVPFLVVSFLYAVIIWKLHKNSTDMANMLNQHQLLSRRKKNKRIIMMSIVIIITFLLLWGPYYMYLFVANFIWRWHYPPEALSNSDVIEFTVQYLGFFNSAVNPWVYFIFLRSYRQGLKRLFSKAWLTTYGSSRLSPSARSAVTEDLIKRERVMTTPV